jgi:hypothetical protein
MSKLHAVVPAMGLTAPPSVECRWCHGLMTLQASAEHPYSAVEICNFVCDCGARDLRTYSRSGRMDDD